MQFTAIESTLAYPATSSNDALHASRTLDHLTSLQTVECAFDFLTTLSSVAVVYRIWLSSIDPVSMTLAQRHLAAEDLLISCILVILLDRAGAAVLDTQPRGAQGYSCSDQGILNPYYLLLPSGQMIGLNYSTAGMKPSTEIGSAELVGHEGVELNHLN